MDKKKKLPVNLKQKLSCNSNQPAR